MVMITESEPVEVEEMEIIDDQEEEAAATANDDNDKPTISKSWSEQFSHAPSFSGGKVTLCKTKGTRHLYGYNEKTKDDNTSVPFLLAPCGGDLTLIDAIHGIKARTIREGCNGNSGGAVGDDDYQDDSMDADEIISYALAPNDCDLITATRSNVLKHYDISGSPSHSYGGGDGRGAAKVRKVLGRSGHDLPVTFIEFHCSGIFFATGSVDGNVKVWDLRGGYATHSFRFHAAGFSNTAASRGGLRGSITCLQWCPDVTKLWLGVGRDDGSIRVHDLRVAKDDEAEVAVEMIDHVGPVTCILWANSDGRSNAFDTFFSAGRDAVINTWAISEEKHEMVVKKKKRKKGKGGDGPTTRMVYKRVQTVPVYENVEALLLLQNYHYYSKGKGDVNKSDVVIASAGNKGIVKIWKSFTRPGDIAQSGIAGIKLLAEQDEAAAFGDERGGYTGLLLTSHKHDLIKTNETSANIHQELIAVDAEHNISFLNLFSSDDADAPSVLESNRTIIGHNDEILDMKIIPDRDVGVRVDVDEALNTRKVAVATNSAQIRIFELGSYSCKVLDGHTETVLSIDVSPCGRYLASSGKDKTMRLWNLANHKCIAVATGHTEAVGATALSRKIGRFDLAGKAAINGGGAFVVTASKDKTLKRWNLPGASVLNKFGSIDNECMDLSVFCSTKAHDKDINVVTVAPNDSLIATGSQDKTVKLWKSTDLGLKGTLKGHKRGIWDCRFSSHDRVIATSSGDKTVKLWSLGDYSCVRTFQGHCAGALRVRFLSGGLQLMSCDAEGLIRLWSIRSNECVFTLDAHDDRIWALDVEDALMVSGGADSRLKVFIDTTKELEEQTRIEEERNIMQEQQLSNHLRFKEYAQALDIALDMDKPRQVLKVLNAMTENDLSKGKSALATLQRHVKTWAISRITQIVKYCREWNTRARNCHVSMLTIKAIVTTKPADQLACVDGLPELLEGIGPYAERHFERIDKLHTNSYLIDFALLTMGQLDVNDNDNDNDEYTEWEKKSKLVLPPKIIDGRVQIGGQAVVGFNADGDEASTSSESVMTVGDSDSDNSSTDSDTE
uniref:U3 small nucleolar RNA-associated protein 13 C-terminal domain-containing protein n=1 Tax=Chaetoceros debilis TaxID=122233 RepID=A0A7S3PTU0_9STRA|mmetsp:Transcript_4445/g.6503  ORF Transcript_4445/g.6503 Transcript_4445/m.6503 type:complete len:1066 (-) Transcript_4445:121-3318(-)